MKKIVISLVALALVFVFAGASCGQKIAEKATEKAVEKSTGADVDLDQGKFSINVNGESYTQEASKIPTGYPSDYKYYSGEVISGSKLSTGDGTNYSIAITTSDSTEKILAFYRENYSKNDWSIVSEYTSTAGSTLSAQKGENTILGVYIFPDSETGKNTISHTLTVQE